MEQRNDSDEEHYFGPESLFYIGDTRSFYVLAYEEEMEKALLNGLRKTENSQTRDAGERMYRIREVKNPDSEPFLANDGFFIVCPVSVMERTLYNNLGLPFFMISEAVKMREDIGRSEINIYRFDEFAGSNRNRKSRPS